MSKEYVSVWSLVSRQGKGSADSVQTPECPRGQWAANEGSSGLPKATFSAKKEHFCRQIMFLQKH